MPGSGVCCDHERRFDAIAIYNNRARFAAGIFHGNCLGIRRRVKHYPSIIQKGFIMLKVYGWNVCPHCHRTIAWLEVEKGASVRSVQDNLGHRSGRTTSTYVHQTAKRTRQSADAIERIAQNLLR